MAFPSLVFYRGSFNVFIFISRGLFKLGPGSSAYFPRAHHSAKSSDVIPGLSVVIRLEAPWEDTDTVQQNGTQNTMISPQMTIQRETT